MRILEWLGGDGVGLSSMAIALAALGEVIKNPPYPHDGSDFGRCYQLLILCDEARAGLERLGKSGDPYWSALVERWAEIEAAYLHDKTLSEKGERNHKKFKCYDIIQSIVRPIEDASRKVIRAKGFTIRLGGE